MSDLDLANSLVMQELVNNLNKKIAFLEATNEFLKEQIKKLHASNTLIIKACEIFEKNSENAAELFEENYKLKHCK